MEPPQPARPQPDPAPAGTPLPAPAGGAGGWLAPTPSSALEQQVQLAREQQDALAQPSTERKPSRIGSVLKLVTVPLLLLTKLKFFTPLISMVVSVAAYALIFGWKFAVGFVLLIFVHEMGHAIQLRREGIAASAPIFIPFLGAMIAAKSLGNNAAAEARVGLAGPVLGSIGTLVPLAIWLITGEELWQALAYTGFLINLFNLLPVLPLDGGRAMSALSPKLWLVGYVMLIVLTVLTRSPIMILILLLGGLELYGRWKRRKDPESLAFHRVTKRQRLATFAVYVGLVVALTIGLEFTYLAQDRL